MVELSKLQVQSTITPVNKPFIVFIVMQYMVVSEITGIFSRLCLLMINLWLEIWAYVYLPALDK